MRVEEKNKGRVGHARTNCLLVGSMDAIDRILAGKYSKRGYESSVGPTFFTMCIFFCSD